MVITFKPVCFCSETIVLTFRMSRVQIQLLSIGEKVDIDHNRFRARFTMVLLWSKIPNEQAQIKC